MLIIFLMPLQGFYYDAHYGEMSLNEDHFEQIASGAKKAASVYLYLSHL